jgi:hypothetical protein
VTVEEAIERAVFGRIRFSEGVHQSKPLACHLNVPAPQFPRRRLAELPSPAGKFLEERGIFDAGPACQPPERWQPHASGVLSHRYSKCSSHFVMALATCMATPFDHRRPLPADALVPDPLFTSTHVITIDAPPEQVWPRIALMGAGRAAWYSWDAIDNGATPSSTSVRPELDELVREMRS